MQTLQQIIGRHTKQLRRERGWTQAMLAEKLNMSLDMVGRIERGQASPSLATLRQLALTLETRPELLLVGDSMIITTSPERERSYGRLNDLINAVEDDELDWIVSILDAIIRKRNSGR